MGNLQLGSLLKTLTCFWGLGNRKAGLQAESERSEGGGDSETLRKDMSHALY